MLLFIHTTPEKNKKKKIDRIFRRETFVSSFVFFLVEGRGFHAALRSALALVSLTTFFFFCLSLFICSANSNPCEKVDSLFLFQLTNGRVPLSLSALCFIPERTNERTKKKMDILCLSARPSGRLVHTRKSCQNFSSFYGFFILLLFFFVFFSKNLAETKSLFVLNDVSKVRLSI